MRCSASSGDRPGARVLIWTCTLVTSGTASIGRRVKFQAPNAPAARANRTTSHRWRMETRSRASIMVGVSLAHLRLHHITVLGDVALADRKTCADLHEFRVGIAKLDRARLDLVAVLAHEHDGPVLERLDRAFAHGNRDVACRKDQLRRD